MLRALYAGAGLVARAAVALGLPGDGKLARTVNGRRGALDRYRAFGRTGRDPTRPLVWFHAPSVGEGLQAAPVMSRLREMRPEVQQAYTHFSPSAAAFAQKTSAEFRDYLPFDDAAEMRVALTSLQPTALVFSKLDVWPVLVREAQARHVKLGMISATLAANSARRGGLAAAITRDAYAALDAVGAIDDADAARLEELGVRAAVIRVTGDTRYDQVWARTQHVNVAAPWLERFRQAPRLTLVAGSTWPADEAELLPAWRALTLRFPGALRLVIAPHEPTPTHLAPIESFAATNHLRCVRLDDDRDADADIVLVNRIGVLGELYALADVAFVGGGFHGAGLHSVLEPAAFGAPVLFGPRFESSRDAALLISDEAAAAVTDVHTLQSRLTTWLSPAEPDARLAAGDRARTRVASGLGAADRATELVVSLLPAR